MTIIIYIYDEPLELSFLVEYPSYFFIVSSGAMKRLTGRWLLVDVMDPDRLLGSCLLRFPPLVSFLVEPPILLGYYLLRTCLWPCRPHSLQWIREKVSVARVGGVDHINRGAKRFPGTVSGLAERGLGAKHRSGLER